MIFKYPYTDMYALNLDWIIQAIKEMQETIAPLDRVVNSVNGLTGDVEITKALLTQILENLVETFNGRTGDVELTAEDVNNTLIDITWTSDPGDTISDLTQAELDEMYLSGKRVLIFVNNLGVADQVYFLQYYEGHAQPQEYSPTSALAGVATFNGQTGNVTATGDDLDTSGTDTRTIAESIEDLEETKVPITRTVNNQALSTNISINAANVPSQAITGATNVEMALGNLNNSKVPNSRQVNGKSLLNDITLNDEDIPSQVISGETTVEGVLTDLDSRVSSQSRQIAEKADIPVTVSVTVDANGATMSAADQAKLTADMVMCWYNGDTSLLTADLTITPGAGTATVTGTASSQTTFTVAFIHSSSGGIASVIGTGVTTRIHVSRTAILSTAGAAVIYKNGTTCIFYINTLIDSSGTGWTKIADIPTGFEPKSYTYEALLTNNFVTEVKPDGIYTYSPVAGKGIEGQVTYFLN